MTLRARAGVALALALFALVTIAAIVHAIVAPGLAHRRAVTRATAHETAVSLAERSLAIALAGRTARQWRDHGVGVTSALPFAPFPESGAAVLHARGGVHIRRLSLSTFLAVAEAELPAPGVSVQVRRAVYLELRPDSGRPSPVLVAGGGLSMPAFAVVGRDTACAGAAGDTLPLVLVAPGAPVSWSWPDDGRIASDSSAARATTYERPAGIDVSRYVAAAAIAIEASRTVSPVPASDGDACLEGPTSWGEPLRGPDALQACARAWPVVHAKGDLRIHGGRGQGILIVDGRLEIVGPFVFRGLVLARGGIAASGGAVSIGGAVFTSPSAGALLDAEEVLLEASHCAVQDALNANAWIAPIRGWPWVARGTLRSRFDERPELGSLRPPTPDRRPQSVMHA